LVGTLIILAVGGSSASAATHGCPNAFYRYRDHGTKQYVEASMIRAEDLHCAGARHLAVRYGSAYRHDYGTPSHLMGFRCRWTRYGDDVGGARCRRADAFVSFSIYDSSPYH